MLRAEAELWPQLGLSWTHGAPVDLDEAFGRSDTPRVLEIGCGTGEAIAALAAESPDVDFVGVDWFRGGLAAALQRLQDVDNVRLLRADAAALLDEGLPDAPLFDLALVFFPDPWRGSSERRIVCPEVARSLKAKMRPGGALWLATDVDDYPDHARRVLAAEREERRRDEGVEVDELVLDQLRVVPVLHAEQRAQHHADQAVQQLRQQRRVEELEERQRRRRRRWRWRRDAEAAEEVGYHVGGVANCAERRWRP